jgi:hypothetical protein
MFSHLTLDLFEFNVLLLGFQQPVLVLLRSYK